MRILHKYVPVKQVRAQLAKWLEWPIEEVELIMNFNCGEEPTYMSRNDCDKWRPHQTSALLDHYYLNDYRITRSTYLEVAQRRYNPRTRDQYFGCRFPIDAPPYKNIYKIPETWRFPCEWRNKFQGDNYSTTFYMFPPGYKPPKEVPTYREPTPEPVARPRWGIDPVL